MRGTPAIVRKNASILRPLYAGGKDLTSPSARQGTPGKTAASLKILGVNRVIGIGLSSDLDMAFQHGPGDGIQTQRLAFTRAALPPGEEPTFSADGEVIALQSAVGFIRMGSPRPAQQLITDDVVRGPKGCGGASSSDAKLIVKSLDPAAERSAGPVQSISRSPRTHRFAFNWM